MKTIVAAILFVFGIIFITTNYRLTIDVKDKWYKEHLWLLGFKIGKAKPYQKIEHIYFNKLRRETEYGFVARLTSRKVIYQGYLKVADDEPIFIGESTKEEPLLKKGEKLAKNLGVEIRKNY